MRTVIALGMSIALSACATPSQKPTDATQQLSGMLSETGFSAIVGGCVIHQTMGGQTLLLEQSAALIGALKARLAAIAKQVGFTVNQTASPLICTDLPAGDRYQLAILRGIPTQGRDFLISNPADQNAWMLTDLDLLNRVLARSWESVDVNRGNIPAGNMSPINISPAHTRAASQLLQANTLLILRGLGAAFSGGKRLQGSLLNSLTPLAITDGSAWAQEFPAEGLVFQAALVDLMQNRVLWAKTSPFAGVNVRTPSSYEADWSQQLLTPVFPADSQAQVRASTSPLFE